MYAIKMKLFQSTQRKFAALGVTPNQSVQTHPFNGKILTTYFLYLLSCIFFFVYFFHVANNFREYVISIYMTSATVVVTINYTTLICHSLNIFKFIENVEKMIGTSKLTSCSIQIDMYVIQLKWLNVFHSFSIEISRIGSKKNRKMEQNHTFCNWHSNTNVLGFTEIHSQSFCLRYQRFGNC